MAPSLFILAPRWHSAYLAHHLAPVLQQRRRCHFHALLAWLQSGGAYRIAIRAKAPRYLPCADTAQRTELTASRRTAQLARCLLDRRDDPFFAQPPAFAH